MNCSQHFPLRGGGPLLDLAESEGMTLFPLRGGGPITARTEESIRLLFPRTWGWTVCVRQFGEASGVIPPSWGWTTSCPAEPAKVIPPSRGWTVRSAAIRSSSLIIPPYMGVGRCSPWWPVGGGELFPLLGGGPRTSSASSFWTSLFPLRGGGPRLVRHSVASVTPPYMGVARGLAHAQWSTVVAVLPPSWGWTSVYGCLLGRSVVIPPSWGWTVHFAQRG